MFKSSSDEIKQVQYILIPDYLHPAWLINYSWLCYLETTAFHYICKCCIHCWAKLGYDKTKLGWVIQQNRAKITTVFYSIISWNRACLKDESEKWRNVTTCSLINPQVSLDITWRWLNINRELEQTRTEKATRTLLNQRFNEGNNGCAPAPQIFVYFFFPFTAQQQRVMAVCQFCLFWRTRATAASLNLSYFHLELNASVTYLFNLNKFWDQKAHWTDLDNWEIRI